MVRAMLLCNHAATCAPRIWKCLPHRILGLDPNVMGTYRLTVTGDALLGRSWWHHVLMLPWAKWLHLEGFKVSTEVQLIHERRCRGEAILVQPFQTPNKEVGVIKEVHGRGRRVTGTFGTPLDPSWSQ